MAQNNKNDNQTVVSHNPFRWAEILDNVIYYRRIFVIIFAVFLLGGSIFAFFATPIYTADVLIQIESQKKNAIGGAIAGGAAGAGGAFDLGVGSNVGAEMAIFSSRNVISRAVESQFLHTTISVRNRFPLIGGLLQKMLPTEEGGLTIAPFGNTDYAWGGEELQFETYVIPSKYQLQPLIFRVGDGRQWTITDEEGRELVKGKNGELFASDDDLWRIQVRLLKAHPGAEFTVTRYPLLSRIGQLSSGLKLAEAVRGSGLIKATFDHPNPFFATRMVNALADAYVQQNTERKSEEADKTLGFLKRQLPDLQARAENSAEKFADYQSQQALPDFTAEVRASLEKSIKIDASIAESNVKRQELLQRYGPLHPAVKAIDGVLAQLKSDKREMSEGLSDLSREQLEYAKLLSNLEVDKQLYVGLRNYQQQLEVAKAGTVGNVYIIDRAVVPGFPSRPNKKMIVSIAGLLGIILGALGAHLFALGAGNVRDPRRLEESTGIKTLAVLPMAVEQNEHINSENKTQAYLLAKERPNSTSIEAIRSLRVALQFALLSKTRQKVVLVTSAVPGQGKSFITANLAYLLAAGGRRVLLLDADIRRTSLRNYFPIGKPNGLSEVLQEKISLDQILVPSICPNLDMIPAGRPAPNPGELFVEGRFAEIIDSVVDSYDIVLIDSPPVLPVNDSVVLSKLADVTIFVARQDKVSVHEIEEAFELFKKSGVEPDGLVFNGFVPSRVRYGMTRYGYYAYRYGYGRYGRYGRYGDKYAAYDNYGLDKAGKEEEQKSLKENLLEDASNIQRKITAWLTNVLRKLRK